MCIESLASDVYGWLFSPQKRDRGKVRVVVVRVKQSYSIYLVTR